MSFKYTAYGGEDEYDQVLEITNDGFERRRDRRSTSRRWTRPGSRSAA